MISKRGMIVALAVMATADPTDAKHRSTRSRGYAVVAIRRRQLDCAQRRRAIIWLQTKRELDALRSTLGDARDLDQLQDDTILN